MRVPVVVAMRVENEVDHQSVVRIFATTQAPAYDSPWQTEVAAHGTGSGVVIAPGKVLTGAHVVADATFLQVQRVSDPHKSVARVASVCHDCDLALLQVDEPRFMEGVVPEELGEISKLRDRVSVVGYPVGGEEISVTEGVVSRIEVQRYSHSDRMVLAVTVDAAINDGNSGGPVFQDGKVAGIAFQTLKEAENIGEMVPASIIAKFLRGTEEGRKPSVPGLGIATQNLDNPLLRRRMGLNGDQTGVRVASLEYGGTAYGKIRVGDALLAIDGQKIANNGTVQYQNRFRTTFDVMLGDHFVGDSLCLTILREGEEQEVELELKPYVALVPRSQYDHRPTFYIYGGIVFQPLSLDYLRTWGRQWWEKAPTEFLHHYYASHRTETRQEVVTLNQILADEINVGYQHMSNTSVALVNGKPPRDLRHFVEMVEQASDVVELTLSDAFVIAFDAKKAKTANAGILDRYQVGDDRSDDLRR